MKPAKPLAFLAMMISLFAMSQNVSRYNVVIDEIMAQPSPQIGLPNNEWIELKNVSSAPVNLQGWRICKSSTQSGAMPSFILQPDSFVIICGSSAVNALSAFGRTISVTSFPSLLKAGDLIFLRSRENSVVHAVNYSSEWYQNTIKANGGWSLEMIDTKNPCTGASNWKASVDTKGGTPGKKNSTDGIMDYQHPLILKNAYTKDSATLLVVFNQPVDSLSGASPGNYILDKGITILSATTLPPLFNSVQLKLNSPLQYQTIYQLTADNIIGCKGNLVTSQNEIRIGLPEESAADDMVINEILFHPETTGNEYVELYNRSKKIIDAAAIYIANRNSSGNISSFKLISNEPFYIFPDDYIVVTKDATKLALSYLVKNPEQVLMISSMPSYPNAAGDVVITNIQGEIIDEVKYSKDWHFKLIDNDKGVAIERIDPDGVSQDPSNWHSAAYSAGYGTPTYQNSQYKQSQTTIAAIEIIPKVFSPDNDGRDDITSIHYRLTERGYVANVTIFDAAGRQVKNLVQNGIMGIKGYWNWDGLNDKGQKLPVGTYIVFTEIFNLQGKKQRFKNAVVLARRL
jgi:hypothetical protein